MTPNQPQPPKLAELTAALTGACQGGRFFVSIFQVDEAGKLTGCAEVGDMPLAALRACVNLLGKQVEAEGKRQGAVALDLPPLPGIVGRRLRGEGQGGCP